MRKFIIAALCLLSLVGCSSKTTDNPDMQTLAKTLENKTVYLKVISYLGDNTYHCESSVTDSVPASVLDMPIDSYIKSDLGNEYGIISLDEVVTYGTEAGDLDPEAYRNYLMEKLGDYTDIYDRFLFYKTDDFDCCYVIGRKIGDRYQVVGGPFESELLFDSIEYDVQLDDNCEITVLDGNSVNTSNFAKYLDYYRSEGHPFLTAQVVVNDGKITKLDEVYLP